MRPPRLPLVWSHTMCLSGSFVFLRCRKERLLLAILNVFFLARCILQGGVIHDLDRRNPWNTQLSHMTVQTLTPQVVGEESKDFSELCKF